MTGSPRNPFRKFLGKFGPKNETQEWSASHAKLWDIVAGSGLKTRVAAEEGSRAVTYFKGHQFCKIVVKLKDKLKQEIPDLFKDLAIDDPEDCQQLGQALLNEGFIYRVSPVHLNIASTSESEKSPETIKAEEQLKKWPNRVMRFRQPWQEAQKFDSKEGSIFVIVYEKKAPWKIALLVGIIIGVLVLCMFPAWPRGMKFLSWYCTVGLSTAFIGLAIIRLILFYFLWFLGIDFWLYPNLFHEDAGLIASFQPAYYYCKREDDKWMKIARGICVILTIAAFFQISRTHSLREINDFAKRQFIDVVEWGEGKIVNGSERPWETPALDTEAANKEILEAKIRDGWINPSVSENETEEEDFSCLKLCGFETFDVLSEECLFDCGCMEELVKTKCFAKCPVNVKSSLEEAKLDACYTAELERKEREEREQNVKSESDEIRTDL
eukprot:GHVP01027406.1.p1 GENE.GHVP01027406.1~~GHVP01027406.1.p1  ORF type:complete len:439 (+),score=83.69 GHVP01027406.1:29-1345(+)